MSWKDVLTLGAAMERAKERSPEVLRENQRALQLMKQRAAAAEALWAGGHTAEAISMARDAYEAASAALTTALLGRGTSHAQDSGPARGRAGLFREAGVRPTDITKAEEAYHAERPLLDDEVSAGDGRRVKAILNVVRSVERALIDDVRSPRGVVAGRLRRWLAVLLLIGGAVGVGLLWASERAREADAAWIARYYARANFVGEPLRRNEDELRFSWGARAPMDGIPADGFSARFDTCLTVSEDQVLRIGSGSDDGARVFVDGIEVLDSWAPHPYTWENAQVEVDAGSHHVRVEFFERDGDATLQVQFRSDDEAELVGELSRPTAPDNGCGETSDSRVRNGTSRGSGRGRSDRGTTRMTAARMDPAPMDTDTTDSTAPTPPAMAPSAEAQRVEPLTQMAANTTPEPSPNMQ